MSFLGEIKRRKVFQVAAVYAVVAWLLVQVIVSIEEPLGLPGWVDTLVIVLVILGFPLALVLSWAYDMTPTGIVRTTRLESSEQTFQRSIATVAQEEISPVDVLPNSVAVLPFENLSPNPDDAYFAAGVHEEILNHLAKIKDMSVIARTSVMQYAGAARPISEIANELRVGAVMEGSVRYAGDRVRVTAQLIEGATGTHLWIETYDRDLADIFAIQTDIASQIATALRVELSLEEQDTIKQAPTNSTEAYALYLKAMEVYLEAGDLSSPAGLPSVRASIQSYLDRAIAVDPNFALAYAWKALVYFLSLVSDPVKKDKWADTRSELDGLIRKHAQKALAINPNIGLAHTVLGLSYLDNWRAAEARVSFERSTALSPNDSQVLFWASNFKLIRNDYEGAVELLRRAVRLDPSNTELYLMLGWDLQKAGDLDGAAKILQKGIAINPGAGVCQLFLARVEVARGNTEEALRTLRTSDRLMTIKGNTIRAEVGWAYGRLGQHEDAERIFNELKEWATKWYVDPGVWAWAYLGLGKYERALELLREVKTNTEILQVQWLLHYTRQNAWSDPVIDEPRFQEVLSGLWVTE